MQYLRAYRDLDAGDDLVFVASTPGVKSDGLEIDQDRWDLERYSSNPVFLWAHDYGSMPLGRAEAWVEGGRLKTRVTKWAGTDMARDVEQAYRDDILNAVSVGWEDVDEDGKPISRGRKAARHVLFDISAVPVPGDPNALIERQRRAWGALGHELLRMAQTDTAEDGLPVAEDDEQLPGKDDGAHEPEANMESDETGARGEEPWAGVAAAMVAVFDRESDDPDEERQREYRALLPKYRRHGCEPPEFVAGSDLRALGDTEWRDLFLAGELDAAAWVTGLRVGAVLNARNKKLLRQAADNISSVLDSAEKPDKATERTADDEPEQRAADEPDVGADTATDPDTEPGEGTPPPLAETTDPLAELRQMRDLITEDHDG